MANNVIVGQSGGPTAVINASLAGVISQARDFEADKMMHLNILLEWCKGLPKRQYER